MHPFTRKHYSATIYASLLLSRQRIFLRVINDANVMRILSAGSTGFATDSNSHPNTNQDFYDVLGVERSASTKDIKAAYYDLSKKYHPDVGGAEKKAGDARRFVEITEAYDTLSNEEKRRAYDALRNTSSRIFDTMNGDEPSDPDLETLREYQRKWNLRRQHYARDQAQRMKTNSGPSKIHPENFDAFYKRYRENIEKARKYDERATAAGDPWSSRREQYSDFQKEMLRKQYQRQVETTQSLTAFTVIFTVTCVFFAIMSAR